MYSFIIFDLVYHHSGIYLTNCLCREAIVYKETSWPFLSPRFCWWFSSCHAGTKVARIVHFVKLCWYLIHNFLFWQISHKYSLIYVITKLGLLFVYDLETATAVYRNRISPDPIFLTSEATSVGGFYAINRRGQVLLATVNEQTIVNFVSGQVCIWSCYHFPIVRGEQGDISTNFIFLLSQLNNLELAVNLAKRGNLPGAEKLVCEFSYWTYYFVIRVLSGLRMVLLNLTCYLWVDFI